MGNRTYALVVLLCFGIATYGQEPSATAALNYPKGNLRFEFTHSMRIPNYHVTVDFYRHPWSKEDSIEMRVMSQPMPGHEQEWSSSVINRTVKVPLADCERLWQMAIALRTEDLAKSFDVMGNDGTTCTIVYGNFQTSVALTVWSPDFDTERRGLGEFYKACKEFLEVAGLRSGKLF